MKLEKINEDKKAGKMTFLLKDSNENFANTIRRLVIEEVPTLAVEDLEIKENSSALFDEMLGLRLGLLPIKTDLKSYRFAENEEEIAERSARCTLQINLKVSRKGYVYAGDSVSADPKCVFAQEKMPIVKLLSKQKIDVTMYAILGRGKDHIKWSPGTAFYKKEPVVKIGKVKNPENLAKFVSDGALTIKGNKVEANKDKIYTSNLLTYYSEIDEGITVDYSDNLLFTVESWGQLECKEMLTVAADILLEKAEALEQSL